MNYQTTRDVQQQNLDSSQIDDVKKKCLIKRKLNAPVRNLALTKVDENRYEYKDQKPKDPPRCIRTKPVRNEYREIFTGSIKESNNAFAKSAWKKNCQQ